MHAIRAGFRKTKEKRGNHALGDDLLPILSNEDSNEASPVNAPLSWEQFSLKDDVKTLLADENLSPNHFHENEETPVDNPKIDESTLLGSKGWESKTEHQENIPPAKNQSTSKVRKLPKWKLAKFGGESEQPLLVESAKNSSRVSDASSRMTPKNVSGWDSIQIEEATTPLSQRPMKNSFGTVLSPRHNMIAICETQTKNDSWTEEQQESTQDNHMEIAVQQRSKTITTFDPFEDVDDFKSEDHEDVYQHTPEMVENAPQINDHELHNEEHHVVNNIDQSSCNDDFGEEEYGVADNDYYENGGMYETEDIEGLAAEESVTSDVYEEIEQYIESDAVHPTIQEGNQFYQSQIGRPQEYSDVFRVDNEDTSNAVEDDSSLISNGIYSVKKLEHIRSIYESKYLRDDSKSPENEEANMYQSASESLDDDEGNVGLRFVALFTEYAGILRQRTEQERAMAILSARGISNVVKVDGSSEENTDVRNMLFEISGEKGKYPQFFLQKDQDVIVYLGDFEWLQYMNDIGSMNDETIFGMSLSHDREADVTNSILFSDRAKAIDAYKREPFRPEISPYHQTEDAELQSHDFVDIDSQCYSDIKSIDVEEEENMQYITRTYGGLDITNEAEEDMISCASTRIQNKDHGDSKAQNSFTDALCEAEDVPESEEVQIDEVSSEDHYDNTENGEESDMETGSFSFRQERRAALLDGASEICEEPSQFGMPIDAEDEAEESESPETEADEQSLEEMEKQARRRERWKRRIIAEHLGSQYVDGKISSIETEDPIGASENEIEMINTFMTVLGSDFDGSMSSKELEQLHRRRAKEAGLTDEFINKMLTAKVSPTASEAVYDDREFTRKTPQPKSKFGCFVDSFWAESSNVVGADMVQNIQAALSGDSDESKRSLRTTGSTDSKSRWRSVEMLESIKASLSGDSTEKSWGPVDMIGTIKATLSGESNENGVIGSIKAAFSMDSTEKAKTVDNPSTPEDLYEC